MKRLVERFEVASKPAWHASCGTRDGPVMTRLEVAPVRVSGHDLVPSMPFEIVGREEDRSSVEAFVGRAEGGAAALVLEGEAGIGKSTLWLAGVELARSRGLRVLLSRPAEAESGLAYAGLGDLFEEALADVASSISMPRRRALEIALLREEAGDDRVDHRAIGVAVRDVLDVLSERGPVLLAVDDVQWLDASSSSALAFALRRLAASRVLVLLARRLVAGDETPALEQALEAGRVERLAVGPLSVGALHRLLQDRSGRSFARQTLLRIHELSGGNPFFALELARVLDVEVDPLEPLPVPQTLDALVRARLAGLPPATRDALALAAALGTPSESLLERAGVAADALAPAAAARVIERENGAIRFTHPLLSSVLYLDLGDERRSVHARIAEIVEDPLLRARHMALSCDAPDAAVAAVLEDAAALAVERGVLAVAAELAEQAVRLTPPAAFDERRRRALAAARAHRGAGEWTRARTIATDLLAEADLGPLRAEALVLLAELEGLHRAVGLVEEALREAVSRPALQSVIQCRLAVAVRFEEGFDGGLDHARAALELADDLDDDALRVGALALLAFFGSAVGDADAPAHAARAYELATAAADAELLRQATDALANVLVDSMELDAARGLLEPAYDEWRERDELWAADVLSYLAWVELWDGCWQVAADYAARALDVSVQYGLDVPWNHLATAVIAAHRGQLDVARAHSELALRLGEEQLGLHTPVHLGTLGFVALQSGDPRAAATWFDEAERTTVRLGWREASKRWWIADHVEALLELGWSEDARRVLDRWEADARRLGRDWVLAHARRCRGLVAAAEGDVDAAASLLQGAAAEHERVHDAFGRARALLALGVVRRRQRQKRAARDAIDEALAGFEELGAATWVAKSRAELGRIGGRTRTEGLTPAERRVAALVAEGRTNREVAAALFLGERTVETHLSRVYAKLGLRSRAELARTFRGDEQSSGGLAISS
jgi:DNA-binding CsgD family transcriptional regulator